MQENAFAGLILVPSAFLKRSVKEQLEQFIDEIKRSGHSFADLKKVVWERVFSLVAQEYEVSAEVIKRRIKYDRLKEELTEEHGM